MAAPAPLSRSKIRRKTLAPKRQDSLLLIA
jgi:hypothetical protein